MMEIKGVVEIAEKNEVGLRKTGLDLQLPESI